MKTTIAISLLRGRFTASTLMCVKRIGRWSVPALFLALVFLPPALFARDYLRLGRQETLVALGIKIRGLRDANPQPLPSPIALTATRRDGVKTEVYDFSELWYHEQCLGRWGNPAGMLILARMAIPVPDDIPTDRRHLVPRADFDAWREREGTAAWTPVARHRWLEQFVGTRLLPEPETMPRGGPAKATTLVFRQAEGATPARWIYLVAPDGQPDRELVLIYEAAAGSDAKKSERAVLQSLASLTFFAPASDEDAAAREMTTRREVKRDDWSPEYRASREQVIRNIGNLKGWWYLPTDNFIIVANLDNRKTIRVLEENLEACRNVFIEFYPIKQPLTAVSVCRIFQERSEYVTYVGPEHEWSGGLWVSARKELVISPTDWGSRQKQREMLVNVIFHESFHQFIHYATGEQHTPIWFNEGNATFFEGLDFKAGGKYNITTTHRDRQIKSMAERDALPSVERLLAMTHEEFIGSARIQNYASVWALVYFLRKGCPVIKREAEYGAILSRYYDAVIATRHPGNATKVAWEGVDLAQFNADFAAFWSSQGNVRKSGRVTPIKYVPAE